MPQWIDQNTYLFLISRWIYEKEHLRNAQVIDYICISECLYYTTHDTVSILQKSHNANILKEPYCLYWRKNKIYWQKVRNKKSLFVPLPKGEKVQNNNWSQSSLLYSLVSRNMARSTNTAFQAKMNLAQLAQKTVWTQTNYKRIGNKQLNYLGYYQYAFLSRSLCNYI